jgi:hypothetical protein
VGLQQRAPRHAGSLLLASRLTISLRSSQAIMGATLRSLKCARRQSRAIRPLNARSGGKIGFQAVRHRNAPAAVSLVMSTEMDVSPRWINVSQDDSGMMPERGLDTRRLCFLAS